MMKFPRIKKKIEAELFGEDQTWNHGESNVRLLVALSGFFFLSVFLPKFLFGSDT